MKFGIKDKYLDELPGIFRQLPCINRVVLYGSRPRGDYRHASDLDICLFGDSISDNDLSELLSKLYDSNIPYFFDVAVWNKIRNKSFADNIQFDGIEIYKQTDVPSRLQTTH